MIIKRTMDFLMAFTMLLAVAWLLVALWCIAWLDTASNGIFLQKRIGQFGKPFTIYKFKTVHPKTRKISSLGRLLRKSKLDELPQLFNVLLGDMSFVGPRPDIPGYADKLVGEDRTILQVKPGVTGLASIKYRNEEKLLAQHPNPIQFNNEVLWPDKVQINKWYVQNQSFKLDVFILLYTVLPIKINVQNFMANWK